MCYISLLFISMAMIDDSYLNKIILYQILYQYNAHIIVK